MMKCKYWFSLILSAFLALTPALSLAEEAAQVVETNFHIDVPAFLDSLQYMLKGLVGIFLVTGLIILVLIILEKVTKGKQEE